MFSNASSSILKYIGMQKIWSKYTMWFKSDEHLTTACHSLAKPCHSFDTDKMYKNAKFDHNIWCCARVISILLKYLDWQKWCSSKPCHHFAYQWLDNVKINKYPKFDTHIPCDSRVMSSFTNLPQLAEMMLSKPSSIKKGCYTYQWLDNIGMHFMQDFDQNITCGSRVMSISLTDRGRTDGQSHIVIIVQTQGSCNNCNYDVHII